MELDFLFLIVAKFIPFAYAFFAFVASGVDLIIIISIRVFLVLIKLLGERNDEVVDVTRS